MRLRIFPTASMHLYSSAALELWDTQFMLEPGPARSTSIRDRNSKTVGNFNCLQHFRRAIPLYTCHHSMLQVCLASSYVRSSCSSCLVVGEHLKPYTLNISLMPIRTLCRIVIHIHIPRQIFFSTQRYRIFCNNVQFNLSNRDTIWIAWN
jgi:hypothetical protein